MTGDRGLRAGGIVFGAVIVAVLALHLLEPPLPVTWGYAHLGRSAGLTTLGVLLALGLPPLIALGLRHPWFAARTHPWPWWLRALAIASGMAILAVAGLRWPQTPISIDPPLFVMAIAKGQVNGRCELTSWFSTLVVTAASRWLSPKSTLLIMCGVLGGVALAAVVGSVRRLARTRGEFVVAAILAGFAFGIVQIAFGDTDEYSIPLALFGLFVWTALRAIDGDGHPIWPLVIAATGPFWYIGMVLLMPGCLVVGIESIRAGRWRAFAIGMATAVLAAGLATIPVHGRPFAWSTFLAFQDASTPGRRAGASPTSNLLPPSVLFTGAHALDVLNIWLLVDPIGIAAIVVLAPVVAGRMLVERTWDAKMWLLAVVAAGQLAYTMTMDALLGSLPDWDLFSYGTVATAVFGAALFLYSTRSYPRSFRALAGLAIATVCVHMLARLNALEVDLPRHLAESPPTVHLPGADPPDE